MVTYIIIVVVYDRRGVEQGLGLSPNAAIGVERVNATGSTYFW